MPIKYIGRTTDFKGKSLWEILGNLKNFGVGRIVIRNRFQRYPEPCYMKILKVAALPVPEKPHEDRKIMVLVEKTFRGITNSKPVQLDSATYKADYVLVHKDEEHKYLQSDISLPEKRVLPQTTDFPPLFSRIMIHQMKTKGIANPEKPQLTLRYNFTNIKNYRLSEKDEAPTVKLNFGPEKHGVFFNNTKQSTSP